MKPPVHVTVQMATVGTPVKVSAHICDNCLLDCNVCSLSIWLVMIN